jgi:hypothetical protein
VGGLGVQRLRGLLRATVVDESEPHGEGENHPDDGGATALPDERGDDRRHDGEQRAQLLRRTRNNRARWEDTGFDLILPAAAAPIGQPPRRGAVEFAKDVGAVESGAARTCGCCPGSGEAAGDRRSWWAPSSEFLDRATGPGDQRHLTEERRGGT